MESTHFDVSIDVAAKRPYTIPSRNNSVIQLSSQSSVGNDQIHYFWGTASITEDFYFEITLKREHAPSAVWLGFVYEKWFTLKEDEKFGPGLEQDATTWNYEPLTGSLKFGSMLYMHDPSTIDADTTIGFGVTNYKDNEEDYWSVIYIRGDGKGKEIVRKECLPNGLYPVIRLAQSSPDLVINSTASFKYQGRQLFHMPHKAPVGLFECSPDRRYAACFSGDDGILTLWRLYCEQDPEFVRHISVPDFTLREFDDPDVLSRQLPHEQFSLAVSNTVDAELPQLVLGRYHTNLLLEDHQLRFLSYDGTDRRRVRSKNFVGRSLNIVGNIYILDDGKTLLVIDSERLFVVDMKLRSLLHTFDRNHLDGINSVLAFGLSSALAMDSKPPLKPLGLDHFLWHNAPNYTTMWHVPTGRLVQAFRYTFQLGDKYDHDTCRNLVAFYGINGLKIFTTQTGISICEANRLDMSEMKVVGVKFVTFNRDPLLVTIDGSDMDCVLGVWNPLTGSRVKEDILITHTLSNEFKHSDVVIDGTEKLSSISFVTPLKATVARFFMKNLNGTQPPPVDNNSSEKLILENPPVEYLLHGQSNQPSVAKLKVVPHKGPPKECHVEISGFKQHPVDIRPEPWNNHALACRWISNDRFVVVGKHAVQIINARTSTYTKHMIEFGWCLPSADATITVIKLITPQDGETVQLMEVEYRHDEKTHKETLDIVTLSISLKHASRYLQFAGENHRSRASAAYEKALKQWLESPEILLINEVEFETKTSTFGHMVRGPSVAAATRTKTVLKANAYRPIFYDNKFWDQSALMEALDIGNFVVVEDIVRYCLKDVLKKDGALLEPGYVAIVIGALPTIARAKPLMAALIAQCISHIQLHRYISGYPEMELDTRNFHNGVFARVEQLSNVKPFPSATQASDHKSPLRVWWAKQQQALTAWWNKERLPHPVRLCISPLYGLNRYPDDRHFKPSVFAQLAFRQSPMFDEPAFSAVVQYKWNVFARRYHHALLALYTAYAVIYLIAVSISPYTLMIPAVKGILITLTVAFLVFLDIRPLLMRWNSITYWLSIYHWVDRAAFVLVLISTILTSPDYDKTVDLQAWTVLSLWFFVVFNLRVFQGLGLFFTLLVRILGNLGWLAVLMTAIIFAFAQAMWVLLRNAPAPASGNPFASMDGSLNTLWQFLSSDFNAIDSWNSGRSTDIMRVLFTFISTMVLLNMLIAVLNNVYTGTREIARKRWIRNRAEFIATVEVFMLSARQRQNRNWFPAMVFYEVSPDKFQRYEETVKSKHPWMNLQSDTESTHVTQVLSDTESTHVK
ncbi:hypothetical protein BC936DRAFT_146855 [Jimgerdemannia flammicorona]|uniref:Ion transport domain-containing protein n=1 Tax=Jimgerdemannia flammicorona TaxID=994334 RepID=A0A433D6Q5_9FUNG|nr:hypothetical protein BC936DRAFT_146855 [Jimgerdemannia flammicorona]